MLKKQHEITQQFEMNERQQKMKHKKALWIPPLLWMGVIFYFSHQPGKESAQMSGWFSDLLDTIVRFLNLDIPQSDLHLLVRKGAHFTEFAILGILLFAALYPARNKLFPSFIAALIIGALYGLADELHQYFIPGRSCQIKDMLIDASGVLFAVLLCCGFILLKKRFQPGANS
jgi:VanZ family protein